MVGQEKHTFKRNNTINRACEVHPHAILYILIAWLIGSRLCPGRNGRSAIHFYCQIFMHIVSFMTYNICIWYPWFTMFILGIHNKQYQLMSGIHYTVDIHNIYGRHPWWQYLCQAFMTNIFMAHVNDTHYLKSGVHDTYNVYIWYPWYTIFWSDIHDAQQ